MKTCIEAGCSAKREDKQTRCRPHRNAHLRQRYQTDPEYRTRLLDRQRAQGTTPLRRRHLPDKLEEQEGRCTICGGDIPRVKGPITSTTRSLDPGAGLMTRATFKRSAPGAIGSRGLGRLTNYSSRWHCLFRSPSDRVVSDMAGPRKKTPLTRLLGLHWGGYLGAELKRRGRP